MDYNQAPLHYSVFLALHIHSRFINSYLRHLSISFQTDFSEPLSQEVNMASAQL